MTTSSALPARNRNRYGITGSIEIVGPCTEKGFDHALVCKIDGETVKWSSKWVPFVGAEFEVPQTIEVDGQKIHGLRGRVSGYFIECGWMGIECVLPENVCTAARIYGVRAGTTVRLFGLDLSPVA